LQPADIFEIFSFLKRPGIGQVDPRHEPAGSFADPLSFGGLRALVENCAQPILYQRGKGRPSAAALRLAWLRKSSGSRTVVRSIICHDNQRYVSMSIAGALYTVEINCLNPVWVDNVAGVRGSEVFYDQHKTPKPNCAVY
jgi:hypothetical protein